MMLCIALFKWEWHKSLPINGKTNEITKLFKKSEIYSEIYQMKSKAEVRAKLRDSLLYHVHYNSIKPVLPGLS